LVAIDRWQEDIEKLTSDLEAANAEINGSIKSLSVNGKVITYTKNDGTTGTITTYDSNTDTKVTNTLNTTTKAYISEYDIVGKRVEKATSAEIFNDYKSNTATGVCAHAEGSGTNASGKHAHAEGLNTTAIGNNSHAEGYSTNKKNSITTSTDPATVVSAWTTDTPFSAALGIASHVEGQDCIASAYSAHAEGWQTKATQ
jgi:hypothetical protein